MCVCVCVCIHMYIPYVCKGEKKIFWFIFSSFFPGFSPQRWNIMWGYRSCLFCGFDELAIFNRWQSYFRRFSFYHQKKSTGFYEDFSERFNRTEFTIFLTQMRKRYITTGWADVQKKKIEDHPVTSVPVVIEVFEEAPVQSGIFKINCMKNILHKISTKCIWYQYTYKKPRHTLAEKATRVKTRVSKSSLHRVQKCRPALRVRILHGSPMCEPQMLCTGLFKSSWCQLYQEGWTEINKDEQSVSSIDLRKQTHACSVSTKNKVRDFHRPKWTFRFCARKEQFFSLFEKVKNQADRGDLLKLSDSFKKYFMKEKKLLVLVVVSYECMMWAVAWPHSLPTWMYSSSVVYETSIY